MKKFIFFLFILTFLVPSVSLAHPGRTDLKGGHTCKTNCSSWGLKDGEYHLHRAKIKEVKTEAKKSSKILTKLKAK